MKLKLIAALVLFFVSATAWSGEEKKAEGPEAMLAGMTEAFKAVRDYSATFEWVEMQGKKEDRRLCDFIFMKPDFQRIKVVEGSDKGSAVAYNPAKSATKVAAKRGFLPVITMSKDSKMISGFFDAGIHNDIETVQKEAARATIEKLGEEKVDSRETVKIQIVPEKPEEYSKTIVWIDKKTNLPLKVEYYEDGKFHARKTWTGLKLDATLKEKDFVP